MNAKRRDKRPICRCHVWAFPHRLSPAKCEPDEDAMLDLYLSHRDLWMRLADRMDYADPEPRGITQPGRSHFDSDADYQAARSER